MDIFDKCPLMWEGGWAFPPATYLSFLKNLKNWPPEGGSIYVIALTDNVKKALSEVHAHVNKEIKYEKEAVDDWRIHKLTDPGIHIGDCDDYAVTKQYLLIKEHHFPKSALRLVYCKRQLEYHLVLAVDTDRGTFILDNISHIVAPWVWFPYKWISREYPGWIFWKKVKSLADSDRLTKRHLRPANTEVLVLGSELLKATQDTNAEMSRLAEFDEKGWSY